jgi:SAM-dependent methyltransferase
MKQKEKTDYNLLDVGCGSKPKGNVNVDFFARGFNPQTGDQIQGEFMSPEKMKNFVNSDATKLPFKNDSFNVVFSSHTIEHVKNPQRMLSEMCRVARRKIIVRCPHRRGSGAVMPFHINYLDENWFRQASQLLGFRIAAFVNSYDYPISNKLKKIASTRLQSGFVWRALRHFERTKLNARVGIPFEIEVWIRKENKPADIGKVKFVVVYDALEIFQRCFASSPHVESGSVLAYHNVDNKPLPKIFNRIIQEHLSEDVWFVFCHQDFILNENLQLRLKGKETEAVYGPVGIRLPENKFSGMITQTDGSFIGVELKNDEPVQTLDEMCLIAHSSLFRKGLRFDETFQYHFYGADLCMQAYTLGFDVYAMQLKCQHKSKTLTGATTSKGYLVAREAFKEKWVQFLPIRTTTALIT